MRAKIEITRPEDIEASMTITMTLGQWERLHGQLANAYPAWELSQKIGELNRALRRTLLADQAEGDA